MSITSTGIVPSQGHLRAACGAWDPVETVDAAGARLAVSRRGRGPALVCLHATGHGARDFEALATRLADSFKTIAIDWPGQGLSPVDAQPASAARYSQLLEEALPRITDGPAIVLGCSIGGAAALDLAARRPDLVRALVLCDPGGLLAVDASVRLGTRAMSAFFAAGARGASWYPRAFDLYYRLVLPAAPARPWRDRIVAACVETAPVLAQAWAGFGRPEADLRARVPEVRCPVLLAWARGDRVIPWSRCRKAASRFRDARVEMFDGGHAAFLEDPARFDAVLGDFAAGLATIGSGARDTAASGQDDASRQPLSVSAIPKTGKGGAAR